VVRVQKNSTFSFGIRTVEDTAIEGSEFEAIDKIIEFSAKQSELIIPIRIFDNEEHQPDTMFYVELYNPETEEAYEEFDTRTVITILDEDFPGTLGFTATSMTV